MEKKKKKKGGKKKKKRRREKGGSLAYFLQVDSRDFVLYSSGRPPWAVGTLKFTVNCGQWRARPPGASSSSSSEESSSSCTKPGMSAAGISAEVLPPRSSVAVPLRVPLRVELAAADAVAAAAVAAPV